MTRTVQHLFMCLFAVSVSLVRCQFRSLAHVLVALLIFLLLSFHQFLVSFFFFPRGEKVPLLVIFLPYGGWTGLCGDLIEATYPSGHQIVVWGTCLPWDLGGLGWFGV